MGLVYPDDRERMQSMISYRTAIHDSDASPEAKGVTDVMHYRVITKHGGVRDVVSIGRMSETEKYGSVVSSSCAPSCLRWTSGVRTR